MPTRDKPGNYVFKTVKSPIGALRIVASSRGVAAISWQSKAFEALFRGSRRADEHPALLDVERQLREYFAGKRRTFALPIDYTGSHFQNTVWKTIATIPYGESRSYAEVAHRIGNFRAARAVGAAIGKNPVAIITPDHRVVGSSGDVRGSASGKLARLTLLAFERKSLARK